MKKPLKEALSQASEALSNLEEGLSALKAEKAKRLKLLLEDSVAKRYEVAFEALWKLFKLAAEDQGTEAQGPKPAISAAFRYRWLGGDPDLWQAFLEARNSGVHEYFSLPKGEYFGLVRRFLPLASAAVKSVNQTTRKGIG